MFIFIEFRPVEILILSAVGFQSISKNAKITPLNFKNKDEI
ncbi:hypothetical protein AC062_0449 [Pasteurellaceae bacterium NI1060]|nr:hypothetical protein AC062_0449 [Pasteurellaceae bacterium NI1060]